MYRILVLILTIIAVSVFSNIECDFKFNEIFTYYLVCINSVAHIQSYTKALVNILKKERKLLKGVF